MRALALALVLASTAARADVSVPLQFRVNGTAALGGHPTLDILAGADVTNVKVVFARGDGKAFTQAVGALKSGKQAAVPVGDATTGKQHWKATVTGDSAQGKWSTTLELDTVIAAPIKVTYDIEHLDLARRTIAFRVSRGITGADISALDETGAPLGKGSATFAGTEAADSWLPITWTQPANTTVAQLKLRVAAGDGMATDVNLTPWSVDVPHEDVNFASDSAAIDASETGKLDASLEKIAATVARVKVIKLQLYVAGHTDTVGPNDKNLKLSRARALAIGGYFRKKGLAIPIVVAGFGEEVLKVATPQDTDERANRRADYVLAPAGGTPPFKGPYLKVHAAWAAIK